MRKTLVLAALVLLPLTVLGERIDDYLVQIAIGKDGNLALTEELMVAFDVPRHGIYRRIPYIYTLPTGERYRLRIWLEEVLVDGAPATVKEYREGDYLVWRIGDPARLVRGSVIYTIRYRVARALRVYGEEVELFWNAIGGEWELPIAHASVVVILPPEVPGAEVRAQGFVGPHGSDMPLQLTFQAGKLTGEAQGLA
ncbi:TPA: DUF2207 domain-containing protein, partial [Candidatus Bipolaricaulota bacterium]|nr:DUF2207 domain-containing protein [Candidatus Bipolaricaulota bacterium]